MGSTALVDMSNGWLMDGMFGRENYEVCVLSREVLWCGGLCGIAGVCTIKGIFLHYESLPFEKYKNEIPNSFHYFHVLGNRNVYLVK